VLEKIYNISPHIIILAQSLVVTYFLCSLHISELIVCLYFFPVLYTSPIFYYALSTIFYLIPIVIACATYSALERKKPTDITNASPWDSLLILWLTIECLSHHHALRFLASLRRFRIRIKDLLDASITLLYLSAQYTLHDHITHEHTLQYNLTTLCGIFIVSYLAYIPLYMLIQGTYTGITFYILTIAVAIIIFYKHFLEAHKLSELPDIRCDSKKILILDHGWNILNIMLIITHCTLLSHQSTLLILYPIIPYASLLYTTPYYLHYICIRVILMYYFYTSHEEMFTEGVYTLRAVTQETFQHIFEMVYDEKNHQKEKIILEEDVLKTTTDHLERESLRAHHNIKHV